MKMSQILWLVKLSLTQYRSNIIKSFSVIGILFTFYLTSFNFLNMSEVSLNYNIIDGKIINTIVD